MLICRLKLNSGDVISHSRKISTGGFDDFQEGLFPGLGGTGLPNFSRDLFTRMLQCFIDSVLWRIDRRLC